jgi:hypothetical protein
MANPIDGIPQVVVECGYRAEILAESCAEVKEFGQVHGLAFGRGGREREPETFQL